MILESTVLNRYIGAFKISSNFCYYLDLKLISMQTEELQI